LESDVLEENSASTGGGLDNDAGSATLINCSVSGNFAGFSGGGVYTIDGSTTLIDCIVSGNTSGYFGGGLSSNFGSTTLLGCTVSGNSATFGGGDFSLGFLTVEFSDFFANQASIRGGAIANRLDIDVLDSKFTDNSAGSAGGGMSMGSGADGSISGCRLSDNRAAFFGFEGFTGGGGIAVLSGSLSIVNTTLYSNSSGTVGGGLLTTFGGAFVTNCTFANDSADGSGGAIDNQGTVDLTDTTLSGDSADLAGGALLNNGSAMLTGCTLSGDSVGGNGGGVYTRGGAYHNGTTTMTNCTVSGNSAGGGGGGLCSYGATTLTTLINCTVSGNSADLGGGFDNLDGTANVGNTIVAGNAATTSGPDAFGTFASEGNNLIGETDGSSGWVTSDLTGTIAQPLEPLLAPLENYGGATQTMALLPGSPAIDAGNNALVPAGITTDQRFGPRIVNGIVDIGAFESSGFTIGVTSGSGQSTGVLTAFPAPLFVTVTANGAGEPVAGGQVTFTPPASGASALLTGSPATISATGTASVTAVANGVVGTYAVTATASGVTTPASFSLANNPLILALNPSAAGALSLTNNASIKTSGIVYVDSSSSSALSASGNAQVTASSIDVHGNVKRSGNAILSPTPVTGAPALAAASLPPPSIMGMNNPAPIILGGNSAKTIESGVYSQISLSGNAKLTMDGGIYIIEGGGFSVSGNARVTGSGVTIVNGGSNYPGSGGAYGSITLSAASTYNLSPATSGIYAGIVFFQPPDNTKAITVTARASGITGTIYAPAAPLSESGNAVVSTSLIVDTLTISVNGALDVVDQVLGVLQNESSRVVLIGDLAFEQASNTKPSSTQGGLHNVSTVPQT
jgi:hypothetical protein